MRQQRSVRQSALSRQTHGSSLIALSCIATMYGCPSTAVEPSGAGSTLGDRSADSSAPKGRIGLAGLLPESERYEIEPRVPSDWVGHELGASAGKWRYAGRPVKASNVTFATPIFDSDATPVAEPENPTMMLITDDEIIEMDVPDADLLRIAKELTARGYASGSLGDFPDESVSVNEEEVLVQKGWSGNVDNRSNLGFANHGTATPYRYIGQLKGDGSTQTTTGGCSGSFVWANGDKGYIITAAHCVIDIVTGNHNDIDFWPRQDRCLTETGGAVSPCTQGPYGEWDADAKVLWSHFANNCVGPGSTYDAACMANDIAMVRVRQRPGASYPGGFSFGWYNSAFLDSQTKYHRGYPNCGDSGDPVPTSPKICLNRTLYGDGSFSKDSGSWPSNGIPRLYNFSSDLSVNHSGGPTYYSAGPVLFGVAIFQTCIGSACGGATNVNVLRALDEATYTQYINFMAL